MRLRGIASSVVMMMAAAPWAACDRVQPPEPAPDVAATGSTAQAVLHQCRDFNRLKNAYFGDLHDHSTFSLDARGFGTRHGPADAFAFARGATLTNVDGTLMTIDRPLDFAVVSDHSEYLAVRAECFDERFPQYQSPYCQDVRGDEQGIHNVLRYMSALECAFGDTACIAAELPQVCHDHPGVCDAVTYAMWTGEQLAANNANDPCDFTAFNSYEWTATPDGNTMHRIVLFADHQVPASPFDYLSFPTVSSLLGRLETWQQGCANTDCDVITIPHNGNISGGLAWEINDLNDEPRLRAAFDRLVEIHQHKGNSECPNDPNDNGYDPACTFEAAPIVDRRDSRGYVRDGLQLGLATWAVAGIDPFQFGFVGATDNHNATPGNVNETTWDGHVAWLDTDPIDRLQRHALDNPGGLTGVWAEENTRGRLFAALKRRETFATTGPRIQVRFYITWEAGNYCQDPNFPRRVVHSDAVPMGGELGPPPTRGAKPTLVMAAWKDQTPLEAVQVIKGIYRGNQILPAQVKTYLPNTPSYFCRTDVDNDYDPDEPIFYYLRVIEAGSPRWSQVDCDATPEARTWCDDHPALEATIHERAYSSPIWSLP